MVVKSNSVGASRVGRLVGLALVLVAPVARADPPDAASLQMDRQLSSGAARESARESRPMLLAAADATSVGSREALFDDTDDALLKTDTKGEPSGADDAPGQPAGASASAIKGFVQLNAARDYETPVHWSQLMTRVNLGTQGDFGGGVKWKLGARYDYDAAYSGSNDFYPSDVKKDQRSNLYLLENYIDFGAGNWEYRLGKQNVVWGEMVGLFFADVVSARNMREFILPSFDMIRIPQWAARAEYFNDDFHAELVWIPVASYNAIGKPGAEFFPFVPPTVPGYATQYEDELLPSRTLSNTNYGLRLSTLVDGWDLSVFAYSSMDIEPTFYRQAVAAPQPTFSYQARHNRIDQYGGTLAKDFGSIVLKGEFVYTHGRDFYVTTPTDSDGVVAQNTVDWALGLDFSLPAETRLNLQAFQRLFLDYQPGLISDKRENGYSVLLNHKFNSKLEAELTWIASFNRTDWLARPRLLWSFERNWRLAVGVDIFDGPPLGFFGRYADKDRVYSELRYSF